MSNKTVNTTIEILGKLYPVRCLESELSSLKQAADYLNQKMSEVKDSGKAINLERIAIITGLNITNEFLELYQKKYHYMDKINQRIKELQEKVDKAIKKTSQTELLYE